MNTREIVEETIASTGSGKSADVCAQAILCHLIQDEMPFRGIELRSFDELAIMMRQADSAHIYAEGGIFYFSAFYKHTDRYPIGRNYFIQTAKLFEVPQLKSKFEVNGIKLPIISAHDFGLLLEEHNFKKRIKAFRERQSKETKLFKGLFEGRTESTNVEKAMFLNTTGCLVCGNDEYQMVSSTLSAQKGFMLGFNLCSKHIDIAKDENSLIEYLAKAYDQPSPIKVMPLGAEEHFNEVKNWLPEALGCELLKASNNTLTLIRPSGLKGIFRLDDLCDYAYMIIDSKGKEVARIDSANHHDVDYGPDHLHPNLRKNKKAVESSFTTGSPLIDTKKIIGLIEQYEAKN
ncbi:hypothetical protein [Paraglaciecola sp.]|uniref:hypothetical protein n=1 Tax=Paraglaciecola sp. TaxID=1920173 RepID=UPI003263E0A8